MVIIGGGAAGVNCALECVDIQLDTVLFETDARAGGQLAEIPHSIRNVATGRFDDGPTLRDTLEESAAILGTRLQLSRPVTRVDLGERWVEVDGGRVHARALVLATGTERQELPAAVDGAFGGAVTYQIEVRRAGPVRRTERRRDRWRRQRHPRRPRAGSVRLDGEARASLGHPLGDADDILEQLHREPRIEVLAGWELESLQGGEHLETVVLRRADGQRLRLAARGVVVKIARVPRTQLVRDQLRARPTRRHHRRQRAADVTRWRVRRRRRGGRCLRTGGGGARAGQPRRPVGVALSPGPGVTPPPGEEVPSAGDVVDPLPARPRRRHANAVGRRARAAVAAPPQQPRPVAARGC